MARDRTHRLSCDDPGRAPHSRKSPNSVSIESSHVKLGGIHPICLAVGFFGGKWMQSILVSLRHLFKDPPHTSTFFSRSI
jgi:hypothetical protein